jgi:hypothetical protein
MVEVCCKVQFYRHSLTGAFLYYPGKGIFARHKYFAGGYKIASAVVEELDILPVISLWLVHLQEV